jgi:hypothetical protein
VHLHSSITRSHHLGPQLGDPVAELGKPPKGCHGAPGQSHQGKVEPDPDQHRLTNATMPVVQLTPLLHHVLSSTCTTTSLEARQVGRSERELLRNTPARTQIRPKMGEIGHMWKIRYRMDSLAAIGGQVLQPGR